MLFDSFNYCSIVMNVKYIVKPQDFLWATSSPYSDDSEFQGIILVLLFALLQEVVADQ